MKQIKPCPFCGSEDLYVRDNSGHYVACKNCDAYGPYGKDDEEAIQLWNLAPRVEDNDCDYPNLTGGCHIFPGRNKEEPKMEKYCKNCVHISEEIEGKVYCCEEININHSCKYWEALNPFGNSRPTCLDCKHRYYSWGGDNICNYCGLEIGNPEGYVCDSWEARESKSPPLNTSNSKGLKKTPKRNNIWQIKTGAGFRCLSLPKQITTKKSWPTCPALKIPEEL